MIYVKFDDQGNAIAISKDYPQELKTGQWNPSWQNRNDWKSFERAEEVAAAVTKLTGKVYLPVEEGSSPRFDIVAAPVVGDDVSYAFNGDSTPDGKIIKVNANYRFVWTNSGKYIRVKKTGGWKRNGTWWLVDGHNYERNPHI